MASEAILIVDDNPQNLKLSYVLLSTKGYEIRIATNAEEALHVLRSFRPRVILMDLQLPGIDGLALTRQLKSDPIHRNIIIIALTAYAMKGDREKALAAGCDDYVSKPIDTDLLQDTIRKHLARSQA